ncbi:MAG: single-stranded-DNA-specific exonuclease RecJ [Bacteroidota bacterium]
MYKKWKYTPLPAQAAILEFAEKLHISPIVSTLLLQREISDLAQAHLFLHPLENQLHDPMLMKGMRTALDRLLKAIKEKELICIYGDYDVDGTTSVAMLYQALTSLGAQAYYYIPDRHKEGYGLSAEGIKQAISKKAAILLCIDCGTKAVNPITQANHAGIDVIVCDHHQPGTTLPPTLAMLNPKQKDCLYPFKELSACGIGYKLLQGLFSQKNISPSHLHTYLDLVAVSIAADIVPMVGENRLLAFHGLQKINSAPSKGLEALLQLIDRPKPYSISDIVFGIAPFINAAGRISHAQEAVKLLLAKNTIQASQQAKVLSAQNASRKHIDTQMTEEAMAMIAAQESQGYTHVLCHEEWHKGLLGIVASRCVEQVYKPTIVLTKEGDQAVGSARSVVGYNLYEALQACAHLFTRYGGHAYAAGITLPFSQVDTLKNEFEQAVASTMPQKARSPIQPINLQLDFSLLTPALYQSLQQLAPFGPANRRPVFSTYPITAKKYWVYQNKHIKMHVQQPPNQSTWEAIGFNMAQYIEVIKSKKPFGIAYTIEQTTFQNRKCLQLILKDISLPS